jgi:thioesterase domain-containing protein
MASQLCASGEDVALLVLLDPRFRRPLGFRYDAWRALRSARERRLAAAVGRRVRRWARRPEATDANSSESTDFAYELERIREQHEPHPSVAPATVLLSAGYDEYDLPAWYLRTILRRRLSWQQFPCEHARLLLPPTVDAVASEIRAALERSDRFDAA